MTSTDLRAWRAHLGITQETAARALGLSVRHIKKLENDYTPISRVIELACAEIARRKQDAA